MLIPKNIRRRVGTYLRGALPGRVYRVLPFGRTGDPTTRLAPPPIGMGARHTHARRAPSAPHPLLCGTTRAPDSGSQNVQRESEKRLSSHLHSASYRGTTRKKSSDSSLGRRPTSKSDEIFEGIILVIELQWCENIDIAVK